MEKGLIGFIRYVKEGSSWERKEGGYSLSVTLNCVIGTGKSSKDIASTWCNHCLGLFYYEDKPVDRYPMVSKGDVYQSVFYFQYKRDYEGFRKMFDTS